MKKILSLIVAVALFATLAPSASAAAREPGGLMSGVVGCCWGMRAAADFNEGKNIGLRDWLELIFVGRLWAAFDGYQGVTRSDLHDADPMYY